MKPYRVMLLLYVLAIVAFAAIGSVPPFLVASSSTRGSRPRISTSSTCWRYHGGGRAGHDRSVDDQPLVRLGDRRGDHLRPEGEAVPPRAADAGCLLHPHPDRVTDVPPHQRCPRRSGRGGDRGLRHLRRVHAGPDAHTDVRAQPAHHRMRPAGPPPLRPARPGPGRPDHPHIQAADAAQRRHEHDHDREVQRGSGALLVKLFGRPAQETA